MRDADRYLTSTEAASIAQVSDRTVRDWCRGENPPPHFETAGGHFRIDREQFPVWLAKKAEERQRRRGA